MTAIAHVSPKVTAPDVSNTRTSLAAAKCLNDGRTFGRCRSLISFIITKAASFSENLCAGTTSLAHWLDAHPAIQWVANPRRPYQVEETGVKEAHVFDDSPKDTRAAMKVILLAHCLASGWGRYAMQINGYEYERRYTVVACQVAIPYRM